MSDYTGKAVVDFLDHAGAHGLMNKGTAGAHASAMRKVLEATNPDGSWEAVDVKSMDVEDVALRFETLCKMEYKPESLQVYKSRFRNAIKMHSEWAENPSGWRYKAERPSATRKRGKKEAPPTDDVAPSANGLSPGDGGSPQPPPPMDPQMVSYPYPLRPGMLVQINLPPDLKAVEAKRLAAFVQSLVTEEQLALPASHDGEAQHV